MKKFTALLIVIILLVSIIGASTVFAASVSISGNSIVQAGKRYTYKVTVKATGFNFISQVTCDGIFSGSSVACDDGRSDNGSLSKTVSINVTVASSAKKGDTGRITVHGSGCSVDENLVPTGSFDISGSKTYTVGTPPASTPKPSVSPTATATPAPTQWDIAAQSVAGMQAGGTLSLDITDSTKIPVSLLTALKDKQGTLTINFGSYSCTIDGKTLGNLPAGTESLDLSMSMEKDAAFSASVGGEDAYQLHFMASGQLPGKFTYSFKADSNKPGDTLYLYYYYDQSGVVEGVQSAVVDPSGYVSFDIYHCSSYFVSGTIISSVGGIATGAQLLEAQNKQAALESQIKAAQDQTALLQSQLESAQSQAAIAPAVSDNVPGIPLAAFIAALIVAAVLGAFLTMLICKAGIFRKKEHKEGTRAQT